MALLPVPISAASERASIKNGVIGSRRCGAGNLQNEFKRGQPYTSPAYGCPHHESTQPGTLILLLHKMRGRHKSLGQKSPKLDQHLGIVCQAENAASRIACRRFQ